MSKLLVEIFYEIYCFFLKFILISFSFLLFFQRQRAHTSADRLHDTLLSAINESSDDEDDEDDRTLVGFKYYYF